jgi:hypothetical protein
LVHVKIPNNDACLAERLEAVMARHRETDEVGLHVVVCVEENGGAAGGLGPFAVRVRVGPGHLQELDVLQSLLAHQRAGRFAALAHLGLVEAFEGDAGDAHQRLQLLEIFGLVGGVMGESLFDRAVVDGGGCHGGGP